MSDLVLSSEERSYYRTLLETRYAERKSVNRDWFPKKGQVEELEKEIKQLEDTLAYDDYEREQMLKEDEEEEDDIDL